ALVAISVSLAGNFRTHNSSDAQQPVIRARIAGSEGQRRVHEQPIVDDLSVKPRRLVDKESHDVWREDVERVTLVARRAVEVEVLREVALEHEQLVSGWANGKTARQIPQDRTALRLQKDVRKCTVEPD